MAFLETPRFGKVEYGEEAVVEFAEGLPAFEADTKFVLIEPPETSPVVFLQSLVHVELCFTTVPAVCVDKGFQLKAAEADLEAIGGMSPDLLCLAILTLREDRTPTANLMAPVVIHRRTRQARQVIQYDSGYLFEHPIGGEGAC
ncbi:MAG: flagellar assembly protein FliW [Bryobacterales bacterium]|nr:flagellar assembly protein FliW [Bryobacterales bacterium]